MGVLSNDLRLVTVLLKICIVIIYNQKCQTVILWQVQIKWVYNITENSHTYTLSFKYGILMSNTLSCRTPIYSLVMTVVDWK